LPVTGYADAGISRDYGTSSYMNYMSVLPLVTISV